MNEIEKSIRLAHLKLRHKASLPPRKLKQTQTPWGLGLFSAVSSVRSISDTRSTLRLAQHQNVLRDPLTGGLRAKQVMDNETLVTI